MTAASGSRLREARQLLEQTRQFISRHPAPAFILEAHHHNWSLDLATGELESEKRHVEERLALYAQLRSVSLPLYTAIT